MFIELTIPEGGTVFVNTDHVLFYLPLEGSGTRVILGHNQKIDVQESIAEIQGIYSVCQSSGSDGQSVSPYFPERGTKLYRELKLKTNDSPALEVIQRVKVLEKERSDRIDQWLLELGVV